MVYRQDGHRGPLPVTTTGCFVASGVALDRLDPLRPRPSVGQHAVVPLAVVEGLLPTITSPAVIRRS